jgi:hypothetical protein
LRSSKVFEDWYQIKEFVVMCVGEPAADWDSMLRVKDIRGWRVIDDDGLFEIATDLRKVLLEVRIVMSEIANEHALT